MATTSTDPEGGAVVVERTPREYGYVGLMARCAPMLTNQFRWSVRVPRPPLALYDTMIRRGEGTSIFLILKILHRPFVAFSRRPFRSSPPFEAGGSVS